MPNDYDAREVARNYGLNISGVIGILIRAKDEGKIDSLEDVLEKLKETGFWISGDIHQDSGTARRRWVMRNE